MILVNGTKLKELNKDLRKIKSSEERIDFIVNNYESIGGVFHKLLLHSGFFVTSNPDELDDIFRRLSLNKEKNIDYLETLDYISYLLKRRQYYKEKLDNIFRKHGANINIKSLFNQIERIKGEMLKGFSLDGYEYPKYILESQFNHILDSIPEIISFIKLNSIKVQNIKETKKQIEINNEIIRIISHSSSIRSHLLSIMMGLTKVEKVTNYNYNGHIFDFVYISLHNLPYWSQLEIYRDLNYRLYMNHIEQEEKIRLMKEVGLIKNFSSELLHIDWSKNALYFSNEAVNRSLELIEMVYGDLEDSFIVENSKFNIKDLVEVLKKLFELQFIKSDSIEENKKISETIVYGEKSIIRALGLSNKHIKVLRLLAFDLGSAGPKEHLISFKPLIRHGKLYYIIPSHFNNVSIEKCIDKILSSEVKLEMNRDGKKGYKFEETIEVFFREMNIEFARVERDGRKDIPEFDGMFLIDEYVFYYDAKASIKPENTMEAYNNLQTIVAKGFSQIIERTKALTDDTKRLIIEEKSGLKLKNKKLAPFILSNHFYFNGYRELLFYENNEEIRVPIIDFNTLKQIIASKQVTLWNYDNKLKKYRKTFQKYINAEQFYNYLCNQINGLETENSPTYQITEDSIAFKIVKPLKIKE